MKQEELLGRANEELERLATRLLDVLEDVFVGSATWDDVALLLTRFDFLHGDVVTAARVVGMLSPWIPELTDVPAGTPLDHSLTMGDAGRDLVGVRLALRSLEELLPAGGSLDLIPGDEWRYPELEDAVKWLLQEKVVTASEFAQMQAADQSSVFSVPTINSVKTLKRLQTTVAESVARGDSIPTFRKSMRQVVNIEKHQEETLYRTHSKRSYVEGMDRTLQQPAVAKIFNYVYFSATHDPRVRKTHKALDGFVAEVGSSLYRMMRSILAEYNCRCSITPINRKRAEKFGIKTLSDLPSFMQSYKNAIPASTSV